ncbi:MAG TPA: flagellar hook capping FlgD N-terminal domain-containing protein [Bryobacteraceae bacterium]|nr:flagellar hook capping FlgD N-terminal domain-containing protein [Bryobacteraceae bacterium]
MTPTLGSSTSIANMSAASQTSPSSSDASSQAGGVDNLANEQTFLQLLVAQLKNQDPLSPADGLQFVQQLAQFSSLEQELQMRQDLDTIKTDVSQPSSTTQTPASSSSQDSSTSTDMQSTPNTQSTSSQNSTNP